MTDEEKIIYEMKKDEEIDKILEELEKQRPVSSIRNIVISEDDIENKRARVWSGNVIPPYTVTEEQVQEAIRLLDERLKQSTL